MVHVSLDSQQLLNYIATRQEKQTFTEYHKSVVVESETFQTKICMFVVLIIDTPRVLCFYIMHIY